METITKTIERKVGESFMSPGMLHRLYCKTREYLQKKEQGKMPLETEPDKRYDAYPIVESFPYKVVLYTCWRGVGIIDLTINVTYLIKDNDLGEKEIATLKEILEREVDGQLLLQ